MADGDRQLAFTTGPVPTSVQVSGPDRVTPKAVNASFDGSGAAGPFLPCLIIVGRTGHEVARIPAPQVAAGASAEVSWFPRVGGSVSGGGGVTVDTEYAQTGGSVSVPGNGTGGHPMKWAHSTGPHLLDYTTPTAPSFIAAGVYAVTINVLMTTPAPTTGFMEARLDAGPTAFLKGMATLDAVTLSTPEVVLSLPPLSFAAGAAFAVDVRQSSGTIRGFAPQSPVGAIVTRLA